MSSVLNGQGYVRSLLTLTGVVLFAIVALPRPAHAQLPSRFDDLAASATAVTNISPLVVPFHDNCARESEFDTRRCVAERPQLQAAARGRLWRAEIPADQRMGVGALVAVSPYDFASHCFRVSVSQITWSGARAGVVTDGRSVLLTTSPSRRGRFPSQPLVVRDVVIPDETAAEAWRSRNRSPENLVVSVVFSVGEPWFERSSPEDMSSWSNFGVTMRVAGLQVRNRETGEVLIETLAAPPAQPVAPATSAGTDPTAGVPPSAAAPALPTPPQPSPLAPSTAAEPVRTPPAPAAPPSSAPPPETVVFSEDFHGVPVGSAPAGWSGDVDAYVVREETAGLRAFRCLHGNAAQFRIPIPALPTNYRLEVRYSYTNRVDGFLRVDLGDIVATFGGRGSGFSALPHANRNPSSEVPAGSPVTVTIERRNNVLRLLLDGREVETTRDRPARGPVTEVRLDLRRNGDMSSFCGAGAAAIPPEAFPTLYRISIVQL